jgi:hypothetical protein
MSAWPDEQEVTQKATSVDGGTTSNSLRIGEKSKDSAAGSADTCASASGNATYRLSTMWPISYLNACNRRLFAALKTGRPFRTDLLNDGCRREIGHRYPDGKNHHAWLRNWFGTPSTIWSGKRRGCREAGKPVLGQQPVLEDADYQFMAHLEFVIRDAWNGPCQDCIITCPDGRFFARRICPVASGSVAVRYGGHNNCFVRICSGLGRCMSLPRPRLLLRIYIHHSRSALGLVTKKRGAAFAAS